MVLQLTMTPLRNPNPLNIIGRRRVAFLLPFFESVNLKNRYNLCDSIEKWIDTNLKGRYYVNNGFGIDDTGKHVTNRLTVGFENKKELSYFMLACPHLKYK